MSGIVPYLMRITSLGSVIKLLTPSQSLYTDEFNQKLARRYTSKGERPRSNHKACLYRSEWGEDWEKYFSVDSVNGQPANELRFQGGKVNNSIVARWIRPKRLMEAFA